MFSRGMVERAGMIVDMIERAGMIERGHLFSPLMVGTWNGKRKELGEWVHLITGATSHTFLTGTS